MNLHAISFGAPNYAFATETDLDPELYNTFKFRGDKTYLSIFDTGTSFTMIPPSVWKAYADYLAKQAELEDQWTIKNGILSFPCSLRQKLPSLYFMFQDENDIKYWTQMDVKDYVFVAPDETIEGNLVCGLAITGNFGEFFLFGNSFLRGYYTIHDMQSGQLGLIPHATSTKSHLLEAQCVDEACYATWPLFGTDDPQSEWTWMIVSFMSAGWAMGYAYGLAPVVRKFVSSGIAVFFDQGLTAAYGSLVWFVLVPAMNDAFIGN